MKTNTGLAAHAQKALCEGWVYGWGAFGQIATAALVDDLVKRYTAANTRWRDYMMTAVADNTRLCDCYGLVKGYLWWRGDGVNPGYNAAQDRNTNSAYNAAKEKGALSDMPEIPGLVLYMKDHVGVYCGGGRFIEMRGSGAGVVEGRIENGGVTRGSKFTHWFMDTNIAYPAETRNSAPSAPDAVNTPVIPNSAGNAQVPADKYIWDYLTVKGLNGHAAAGIIGNLFAESALSPVNLQNSAERRLGMNDAEYTAAADSGAYTDFIHDGAGYGLCQWTHWSRKEGLLSMARERGVSIGDLNLQLDFMWQELRGYSGVMDILKTAAEVRQASDSFMTGFLRPADCGDAVKIKRAAYGIGYYDKFAAFKEYRVRIDADMLNIRRGPSVEAEITGVIGDRGVYAVTEEKADNRGVIWHRLKDGRGWVSSAHTARLA